MEQISFENLSFLVVDDNPHMRKLLHLLLKSFNASSIYDASDGAEALKRLRTLAADILIVDWEMSPLDGLELVRMVRTGSDSPNPYIPILMITGHSELHRVEEARDAGVNEFLVKPVSAKSLYARVATVVLRPRPFVRSRTYFGPDRRRRQDPKYNGPERRKANKGG